MTYSGDRLINDEAMYEVPGTRLRELREAESARDDLTAELALMKTQRDGYITRVGELEDALSEIADTFEIDWHEAQCIARDALERTRKETK